MTTEYKSALTLVREGTAKFMALRADYHNLKINDAEFLAAKAEYTKIEALFEKAFAEEASLPENNQCDCGEDTCVGLDCL